MRNECFGLPAAALDGMLMRLDLALLKPGLKGTYLP
jgi:hypothetical protein